MATDFSRIEVRTDSARAERVLAEALEAGASGAEERDRAAGSVTLVLYAPADRAASVVAAARAVAPEPGAVAEPAAEPAVDWSERWRDGLAAVAVSPRLVVRPSFVPPHASEARGARALVIDPGQAFGTGTHESTRLLLEELDARAPLAGLRVLDVGTGSGVLALAALHFGARAAVAFDLDPVALPEARRHARENALTTGFHAFAGPESALAPARFDLVLANLLRRELEPLLPALAARLAPGGRALLAGLLDADVARLAPRFAAIGWREETRRQRADANGEQWVALVMTA